MRKAIALLFIACMFATFIRVPAGFSLSAAGGSGPAGAPGSPGATPSISPVPTSVATATTVPLDLSQGINRSITLNASGATLSCSNPTAGQTYKFKIIQGSGGSFTLAGWCSSTNWAGGSTGGGGSPTLSTAAASYDVIVCYYDGTYYSCDIEKGFVP